MDLLKENKITEAERLAFESYTNKVNAEKELRVKQSWEKIQAILNEDKCTLKVIYVQNNSFLPSIAEIVLEAL
jgi:hypothetical protein